MKADFSETWRECSRSMTADNVHGLEKLSLMNFQIQILHQVLILHEKS